MKLDPEETRPAVLRLKRAKGQLEAVLRMLEAGAECEEVVTQVAAAAKATNRAGLLLVSIGMRRCLTEQGPESVDQQRLEKLLLGLS